MSNIDPFYLSPEPAQYYFKRHIEIDLLKPGVICWKIESENLSDENFLQKRRDELTDEGRLIMEEILKMFPINLIEVVIDMHQVSVIYDVNYLLNKFIWRQIVLKRQRENKE